MMQATRCAAMLSRATSLCRTAPLVPVVASLAPRVAAPAVARWFGKQSMRRKREEQANDKYAHLRKVERDRVWGEEGFTVQDGPEGMKIQDEVIGLGPTAEEGKLVWLFYKIMLPDGTMVESSYNTMKDADDYPEAISFRLGERKVIRGMELVVTGMNEGGVRKALVPPQLAFGEKGANGVPPNSPIVLEVRLGEVEMQDESS